MIRLVLIGTGNVAHHLLHAFLAYDGCQVLQLAGRDHKALGTYEKMCETTGIETVNPDADIYIIAVSDDSIPPVVKQLNLPNKLVAHTSGSMSMDSLGTGQRRAVFYPLQTFSKARKLSMANVPICLEAGRESDLHLLKQLASGISGHVLEVPSSKRPYLHLAAVFANNFTNHMFHLAHEILSSEELPLDLLLPLMKETVGKLEDVSPFEAQTGPARRQDTGTMAKHRKFLTQATHEQVYTLLSNSIRETYGKKL